VTADEAGRPDCREVQTLLGVYVLGAIDRTERPLVDEHLRDCVRCRDELAGLAPLPAMLGRVSLEEAERIAAGGHDEPAELSPDVLNSLLRQVSRRRGRLWRGAVAVAAAAIIAAGAVTAIELTRGGASPAGGREVATGVDWSTHVWAQVHYADSPAGLAAMRVEVRGIKPGTPCTFWVVSSSGRRVRAGAWTVGSYGLAPFYRAGTSVPASSVHSFQITSAGKLLVNIPAT
jgi:Putative zinc-finger